MSLDCTTSQPQRTCIQQSIEQTKVNYCYFGTQIFFKNTKQNKKETKQKRQKKAQPAHKDPHTYKQRKQTRVQFTNLSILFLPNVITLCKSFRIPQHTHTHTHKNKKETNNCATKKCHWSMYESEHKHSITNKTKAITIIFV